MRHSLRLPGVLRVALVAGAALLAAACSDDSSDGTTDPGPSGAKTITATLAASGEFTTLTAALEAADLDGTLAGAGPFTLFAPTDAAFAKLPAGTVEGLLADIPALTRVLQYHVTSGEVDAAAVSASASVATLLGVAVPVMVEADGTVVLNGAAAVTSADVVASNGVIHVIDTVLLPPDDPPPSNTITDIVTSDDRFETLATAVAAAGLGDTLAGDGPFTVFAPTDDAFAALPAGTLDTLLADQAALTDVLTYHVVDGEVTASQVVGLSEAVAKNGVAIGIEVVDGAVVLNGTVHVTITDIVADNGVIHVIDGVLVPPPTIAELVATDPDFSTLRAAVEAAGLGEALAGDGPFTVFAPTDAAFAKIPEADLQALLADKAALTDVLTYHALTGRHLAAEVTGVTYLT
ncbi:MAG: fasciclin domain-containing protein, partial [Myxococcales bacterium]|nr:fasciclin domain-containing protein [Myxococcales bacterium]